MLNRFKIIFQKKLLLKMNKIKFCLLYIHNTKHECLADITLCWTNIKKSTKSKFKLHMHH